MNAERLIGSIITGALVGRRKRGRRARRFLLGGRGSFLSASALLTAAGVVWGLLEGQGTPSSPNRSASGVPPAPAEGDSGADRVPANLQCLVRVIISAARADGTLAPEEEEAIREHAREAGVEDLVAHELLVKRPLPDILAGVKDRRLREDLYTLAFSIVRADETVTGAERIYLAQLSQELNLDAETTIRLERDAENGINSQPE